MSREEALRRILGNTPAPRRESVPLARAAGRVLAEEIVADLDLPPFSRAAMDGYAVRAADVSRVPADLPVAVEIFAGDSPEAPLPPGTAARIMTGAPVPPGADAVVMVERTERLPGGGVRLHHAPAAGEHVCPGGEDVRAGERLLPPGRRIRPAEIAVLAAAGVTEVPVHAAPRVAVGTTGDELVPPDRVPGPGGIRNANTPSLAARIRRDGGRVTELPIVPDEEGATREAVEDALAGHDLVVLTGGVSMGERDLVPGVLEGMGMRRVLHGVRVKPGKPLLVGDLEGRLFFGLPGNPVSSAVGYELFVRPVLRRMLGLLPVSRPLLDARLAAGRPRPIAREQFLPCRLRLGPSGLAAELVSWNGSGDLVGFAAADGLLVVPAGGPAPEEGGPARVVVLDDALEHLAGTDADA